MEQMIQDLIRQVNDLQTKVDGLVKPEKLDNRFINSYTINGASSQFATAQAAIDFAEANGFLHVYVPNGSYDNIVITVGGMRLELGPKADFADTNSHCLDIQADDCLVTGGRLFGTAGGGNARNCLNIGNGFDRNTIIGTRIGGGDQHGAYIDSNLNRLLGCFFLGVDGTRLVLDTNSDENIIDGCVNLDGDVTDNGGAGNTIGSNS